MKKRKSKNFFASLSKGLTDCTFVGFLASSFTGFLALGFAFLADCGSKKRKKRK